MADLEAAKGENEGSEDHGDSVDLTKEIMKNPEMLAAVQDQLMMKSPADYIKSLPKCVKRRVKALKRLQSDVNKIESKFYEEVHELEMKYASQYNPLYERRQQIVTAQVEPTDEECDWPSDEEDLADEIKEKAKIEEISETKDTSEEAMNRENTKGIPDFWLTIFKNVDMIAEMIQPHDELILKHMLDLQLKLKASSGFVLEFIFEPNDYFSNPVLTKEYFIRFNLDTENPLGYEGPDIIKCAGCTIDWKPGKNVTVRQVKKVQKHKNRGTKRTVTQTVKNDSFFNFFDPPKVEEDEEPDEDTEALLTADFEIGHFMRENIIPRAILYFTGEALEDDDDYEGDEEDEDDDDDDDDSDEEGENVRHTTEATK
jgi:nucleosome assembly protein 1-like 1